MSSIYESLKKEWASTLKRANDVGYIGVLEVDLNTKSGEFFPLIDDEVDWDSPEVFRQIDPKVMSKIVRATLGHHQDGKIDMPIVRLDAANSRITNAGIPLWDCVQHSNLSRFKEYLEDLSIEASLAWQAAELVDTAFENAMEAGPPCPMAGYAPRFRDLRESMRQTMEDAESSIPLADIAKDHSWRIAVMADALLTSCQKQSQWSTTIQTSQTQEAIAQLEVMVLQRKLHLAELEGEETEIEKWSKLFVSAESSLIKVSRIARNAEMTTAVALS